MCERHLCLDCQDTPLIRLTITHKSANPCCGIGILPADESASYTAASDEETDKRSLLVSPELN